MTKIVTLLALIGLHASQGARLTKSKRGSLYGDYSFPDSTLGYHSDITYQPSGGWKVTTGDFNLNVDLPPPPPPRRLPSPSISVLPRPIAPIGIISNSIENKPVLESQEYIPPQSSGSAILPQMPIPAIPVNAVASNIPASRGAVFLGSGSIGVVNLGNGAYALGSGSLGYSENRSRPRPTSSVPVYPPIRATPDLLPAAVPTPLPLQSGQPQFLPPNLDFNHPLLNIPQVPQVDQNGYEYLPPNRVGFGSPNPPRPLRVRQQFATPTALQVQPQFQPQPQPQPQVLQIPNSIQFSQPLEGHPDLSGFPILS